MRYLQPLCLSLTILFAILISGCTTHKLNQTQNTNLNGQDSTISRTDNLAGLPPKDGFNNAYELKQWLNSIKPAAGYKNN